MLLRVMNWPWVDFRTIYISTVGKVGNIIATREADTLVFSETSIRRCSLSEGQII